MGGEEAQEFVFARGEWRLGAVGRDDGEARAVDHVGAEAEGGVGAGGRDGDEAGAAEKGGDAGEEFAEAEGLGHVVVRPGAEPGDLVAFGRARGEHQDGQGGVAAADFGADGDAVALRHHNVEHEEVRTLRGVGGEGGFAVWDRPHGVALRLQRDGDPFADVRIVFREEDLRHGDTPSRMRALRPRACSASPSPARWCRGSPGGRRRRGVPRGRGPRRAKST